MKRGARLAELGEDAVVRAITRALPLGEDVRAGAGDDCAVIGAPEAREWTLLKTDAVVGGVHFDDAADPQRVGWKALCRAISDIAAMGGEPRHALITIAAPPEMPFAWLDGLYRGMRGAAQKHGVSIVGGETARSPGPIFISVTLTGVVARARCILRSRGKAGDALFVTGTLGGSLAGKHLDFTPRLAEAQFLAREFRPSAMMDLSDGLAADLPRLADASRCSFHLELDCVPVAPGCTLREALSDGEDFELLFAIAPSKAPKLEVAWQKAFPKLRLTRIGALLSPRKKSTDLSAHGYDHFA